MKAITFVGAFGILFVAGYVDASVSEFSMLAQWQSAAGRVSTIGFADLPAFTVVTTQYQSEGVVFSDGTDFTVAGPSYPQDGSGLIGGDTGITVSFQAPVNAVAIHFPGDLKILLFDHGTLIYTSSLFHASGIEGINGFGGLVSTVSFDSILIGDPLGGTAIDNLYFGPAVPAPAGFAVLAGLLTVRRRGIIVGAPTVRRAGRDACPA